MARVNDSRVSADRLRRTAEERLLAEPVGYGIASAENGDQFAEALKLADERMYQD